MLDMSHVATTNEREIWALTGEVTADQIGRIREVIESAASRGRPVSLDFERVWRVDRGAAASLAHHAFRPGNQVRIVGVSTGLLEWLRSVMTEAS